MCLQVLLNMLEFGMNPQQALDAPRVFVQYDAACKSCSAQSQKQSQANGCARGGGGCLIAIVSVQMLVL